MPRSNKFTKFSLQAARKSGAYKNKMILCVNHCYEGDLDSISLQDLLDFLQERKINLSDVKISAPFFITTIKVN